MNKQAVAVIGLGRFGATVAKTLSAQGHEVLGVDINEETVQRISPYVTHAVVADTSDEDALRALSLNQFDDVVIGIGDNVQGNLMTAMLVKEIGAKYIVAKAQSTLQGRLLEKIGVDLVIYPESDMALRVAQMLVREHVIDYLQLSKDIGLVEMETPAFLQGKTLIEANIRAKYNVNVVAIKRDNDVLAPPDPNDPLRGTDTLMIIGRDPDITRLEEGK
ncbi:TrkA family potassium uptake protein [Veillonella magna]|jgi:trk system potassium uptake protein TrkA|uniref:TrkA family potassium uptake protein n=1 Tax=Veillonella magna TaxID=464322 RepID=A0ABS2GGY2_9FIRM|nr:TrkA family potassium uptake protein [Veillonella magna]MBD8976665.1 TrkA family potassium uptake protein [Veillonella magna]MBM6825130.1 TrkA family potassium uptake protein [Veillonella magna]MBM6913439.1 TrkA family potassium uptake protein [Veillonella magna]